MLKDIDFTNKEAYDKYQDTLLELTETKRKLKKICWFKWYLFIIFGILVCTTLGNIGYHLMEHSEWCKVRSSIR